MKEVTLTISHYCDISMENNVPHIYSAHFLGQAEDAFFEDSVSLESAIDSYIDMNIIPSGIVTEKQRGDILNSLLEIQKLVSRKIEEVEALPNYNNKAKEKVKKTKEKKKKRKSN